jgi:transcriptional regulator with XRE-family HTH domain
MQKAIKLFLKENTTFDLVFLDGSVKRYDILSLADKFPQLNELKNRKLFLKGRLFGWSGVYWNSELDISAETVYYDGLDVTNEYDNAKISNMVLGYTIKEKRLEKELAQMELAYKSGIDQSDLSKIERGSLNPSVKVLNKIADGLDSNLNFSFETANFNASNLVKDKKYMRIQGEELAYKTKKPVGVFVLTWRRVRDGIYSEEDKNTYLAVDKWFKENFPEPPFYGDNNDNSQGATTWFKTNNSIN